MAFTTADLDAIDRAIASGELTVRTQDRMVTYRSMPELREARDVVANAIAVQSGKSSSFPRHQLASFSDD